jgi:hypothetical protein
MKKIVTLLFTIVPLISFGQKNEIGIGIGTLQYTTGAYIPKNSKSIKNSFFFTKKIKLFFMDMTKMNIIKQKIHLSFIIP